MVRLVSAVLSVALLSACNASVDSTNEVPPSNERASERLSIAVIPKGTTHEFWKSVHYGAAKAGEDLDVGIEWLGPLQEDERDAQITVVQNFITRQVDGICLAPLDSQALVASVREAARDDIPVVIFDSGLDDENSYVSYVATDNFHGGELAAEEMSRLLGGQGNVILLRYAPGSDSTTQREEGFLSKIKDYPNITVISADQYAGATPETALDKSQQLLIKFRDDVDGIFVVNESAATGMLGALREQQLAGKVKFIGFDSSPRLVQAMRDGAVSALILQDPVGMGYKAVETIVKHLRGEKVDKRISTGENVVNAQNMDDPAMAQLVSPAQFEQ